MTTTDSLQHAPGDSLAGGAAGIALLHVTRAHTGTGTWDTAHTWVSAMAREPVTSHPAFAGLYRGAPAVAFALHTAGLPCYAPGLSTLDDHVRALTQHRLSAAHKRIDRRQLPVPGEYDLITGLTGLGVYVLHRDRDPDLLHDTLVYLVRLTETVTGAEATLPGWWCRNDPADTPPGNLAVHPARCWRGGGHGNLGLAHGITGPLALLSIAARRGHIVSGHHDAIRTILTWLDIWCSGPSTRRWWPGRITGDEQRSGVLTQHGPQRPSWCYGTPGIARAQQLAAIALNDQDRQRHVETIMARCVTDPHQLAHLSDLSLCHGWAGLVHTTWRAALDAGHDSDLAAAVPHLRRQLDQHTAQHGLPDGGGFLEGPEGIRLVQHTDTRTDRPEPSTTRWDTCLLLSG